MIDARSATLRGGALTCVIATSSPVASVHEQRSMYSSALSITAAGVVLRLENLNRLCSRCTIEFIGDKTLRCIVCVLLSVLLEGSQVANDLGVHRVERRRYFTCASWVTIRSVFEKLSIHLNPPSQTGRSTAYACLL